ncbi:MAG: metallophosphoesterase [Phycisphaeraceae bacterium]
MPPDQGLLQPARLDLPNLPPRLAGCRLAHLSDLHVRRPRSRRNPRSPRSNRLHERLLRQLGHAPPIDLLLLTGDYTNHPGDEPATLDLLRQLLDRLQPRLGAFGVFGNHDTPDFRQQARTLPVHWLANDTVALPGHDLEIWGLDTNPADGGADSLAMLARRQSLPTPASAATGDAPAHPPLRLLLAHSPSHLTVAADLHADLLLAGHTHGGQCRLPHGQALVNACDMPLHLVAGILRHRDTLAAISRGIGHTGRIPRVFCPPHVPIYTLHHGPLPGQFTQGVDNVQPW